jgi:hypothetical protein
MSQNFTHCCCITNLARHLSCYKSMIEIEAYYRQDKIYSLYHVFDFDIGFIEFWRFFYGTRCFA